MPVFFSEVEINQSLRRKFKEKALALRKILLTRNSKLEEKTPKSWKSPSNSSKNSKKIINQEPKIGALNPNSVLCTDQAPSPAFSALNPGSALNPRTLNPGTTVLL